LTGLAVPTLRQIKAFSNWQGLISAQLIQ